MTTLKSKCALLDKICDSIEGLSVKATQKACMEALAAGIDPYQCITEGLSKGLETVGKKYEEKEFFLGELIMAGEAMKEGMKILEPHLQGSENLMRGKVVIGTVKGDLHDIGKNIVISLLKANGFLVYDLGVDVPVNKFVEAVKENKPDILAMSALLTTTLDVMDQVVRELEMAGIRQDVKIIIGGGAVSDAFAKKIGINGATTDAVVGVNLCRKWMDEKQTKNI